MSLTHFRRVFQPGVGRAPLQYLIRLRVHMAAAMLQRTNRTVLDIAMDVGYPTLSSFNRHFKSVTGMAPSQWRERGT